MSKVPAPLFRDPIFDGAADPMIIRNEENKKLYMFYTQRRASAPGPGVSYCYGSKIGVAVSENGGSYWYYWGALDLDFEPGHNTYWAPEIIYHNETQTYHMYVSYIKGIRHMWGGTATIEHYTSKNLMEWTHLGQITLSSSTVIDPCIAKLPNGKYRMWYKDEMHNAHTYAADSEDMTNWEVVGAIITDCAHEGPNVFSLKDKHYMIVDTWNGLGVYSSDDMQIFTRQKNNILKESGTRKDDCGRGAHADVFVHGDDAYIVYFTHPESHKYDGSMDGGLHDIPYYAKRTSIQLAKLELFNGEIICDRNAEFEINI